VDAGGAAVRSQRRVMSGEQFKLSVRYGGTLVLNHAVLNNNKEVGPPVRWFVIHNSVVSVMRCTRLVGPVSPPV